MRSKTQVTVSRDFDKLALGNGNLRVAVSGQFLTVVKKASS